MFSRLPRPRPVKQFVVPTIAPGQCSAWVLPQAAWFNFGGVAGSVYVRHAEGRHPVRFWFSSPDGPPPNPNDPQTPGVKLSCQQTLNMDDVRVTGILAKTEGKGSARLDIIWRPPPRGGN